MCECITLGKKCKSCKASWMRDYRKKNPGIFKNIDLKKKFGISLEDYNFLLTTQNFVCKICGKDEKHKNHTGKTFRLSVDHCHKTGKIRGLLCIACNTSLGLLDENIEFFRNAINYLEEHK